MACPICNGSMTACFTTQVLGKHQARFEVCTGCGFLRAHEPYWLHEAYSRAIAVADTGLVMRNVSLACKFAGALYWAMDERGNGCYLDAAGGYGMLVRLMRDLGFDFFWADKYCDNLLAAGFEFDASKGKCRAVTAVEVIEHLTDPGAFIEETLANTDAESFLFTTELYEGLPPQPGKWWYYSFATGQHIGFFQRRTLEVLAAKLGFRFASANGVHIFSKKPINHLLLYAVTNRWIAPVSAWWVRRQLGTKTVTDHETMLKRIG